MKYDLSNKLKLDMFMQYANKLLNKQAYVELREIKPKRNLDQNGLYWVWLTCLQVEIGMTKDEFHVLYRAKFLRRSDEYVLKIIKPNIWDRIKELSELFHYRPEFREIIDLISKSTTELDEGQFARYLTAIKDHAYNNYNVVLLTLDDEHGMEFYKEYLRYM